VTLDGVEQITVLNVAEAVTAIVFAENAKMGHELSDAHLGC
jgi:hypothetical protein